MYGFGIARAQSVSVPPETDGARWGGPVLPHMILAGTRCAAAQETRRQSSADRTGWRAFCTRRALDTEPRCLPWPWHVLYRRNLHEEAVPAYRAAAALDPDSLIANEGLGLALDGMGRHAEGSEFHNRAAEIRTARERRHSRA